MFCALAVFVGNIIFSGRKIKDHIAEDPSLVSKVLVAVNCVICVLGCVYLTTKIDIDAAQTPIAPADTSGFETLVYLIFLWHVISILIGGALAVLSMNAAMIVFCIKNGIGALNRFSDVPGSESGAWSGMYAGTVVSSYIIVLLSLQGCAANGANAPFIGNW